MNIIQPLENIPTQVSIYTLHACGSDITWKETQVYTWAGNKTWTVNKIQINHIKLIAPIKFCWNESIAQIRCWRGYNVSSFERRVTVSVTLCCGMMQCPHDFPPCSLVLHLHSYKASRCHLPFTGMNLTVNMGAGILPACKGWADCPAAPTSQWNV